MNIFKSIIKLIKFKLYLKIAKINLQIIQSFEKQKEQLNEIMTTYKVEDKLVELKPPKYNFYVAKKKISLKDTLNNEISESDIPSDVEVNRIKNSFLINNEGYYYLCNTTTEYFEVKNGIIHVTSFDENNEYKEIHSNNIPSADGFYKKIIKTGKYYYAKYKICINNIPVPTADELPQFKLVNDISLIEDEGYYKVIVKNNEKI